MAGLGVTIQITGDKELIDKLGRFKASLMDWTDAMKELGHELGDGDSGYFPTTSFSDQGGNLGVTWPTDTMQTMLRKRRSQGSSSAATTLIRTGTMQKSFYYEATKNSVTVGNNVPGDYFKYHQSTEPRTKMPYRPMMGINDDVKNIVKSVLKKDMEDKIERLR